MPTLYPPHLTAHAEPSPAAYHVNCPQCRQAVGGAWAEAIGPGQYAVHCPQCHTTAPGRFAADCPLSVGAYSGRAISSLRSEQERDYLDYLLQMREGELASDNPRVRLAILWQLGWLSAARQTVAAGPNIDRLRAGASYWLREQAAPAAPVLSPVELEREQARLNSQASWLRQFEAEQERQRGNQPRRQQQFHEYKRPPMPQGESGPIYGQPQPEERPEWAVVLGLTLPVNEKQVKRAYRRLSKANHPDRGGDTARMQQIAQARQEADKWLSRVLN